VNLLEGRVAIPPGTEHPLQYAFVEGLQYPMDLIIYGTEQLDDDEVLAALLPYIGDMRDDGRQRLTHLAAYRAGIRIDRYNRCPTCEQWSPCQARRKRASD
jgi:hypothetical protein